MSRKNAKRGSDARGYARKTESLTHVWLTRKCPPTGNASAESESVERGYFWMAKNATDVGLDVVRETHGTEIGSVTMFRTAMASVTRKRPRGMRVSVNAWQASGENAKWTVYDSATLGTASWAQYSMKLEPAWMLRGVHVPAQ